MLCHYLDINLVKTQWKRDSAHSLHSQTQFLQRFSKHTMVFKILRLVSLVTFQPFFLSVCYTNELSVSQNSKSRTLLLLLKVLLLTCLKGLHCVTKQQHNFYKHEIRLVARCDYPLLRFGAMNKNK